MTLVSVLCIQLSGEAYNGFACGLIAIVLYPAATALGRRRWARIGNRDCFDLFRETGPLDPEKTRDGIKTPCAADAPESGDPPARGGDES